MVKNLPSNAGDVGSIPDPGTKTPYSVGAMRDPKRPGACAPDKRNLSTTNETQQTQNLKKKVLGARFYPSALRSERDGVQMVYWKGDGWKQGWGFGVGRGELLTEAV